MAKKFFQKALSVGLSLALCAGMVAPAFAEEELAPDLGGDPPTANEPAPQGDEPAAVAEIVTVGEDGTESTTQYSSIDEAINAADGKTTIRLTGNVEGSVEIPEGADIVLDLNGHTLTGAAKTTAINNKGTLTVQGEGAVRGNAGKALYNAEGATANLNGGKFDCSAKGGNYVVQNQGTMVIDGANLEAGEFGNYTILANGWDGDGKKLDGWEKRANLTVNSGKISSTNATGIKNDSFGVLVVNGGTIDVNGKNKSCILNWYQAEINDGTFISHGVEKEYGNHAYPATITTGSSNVKSTSSRLVINGGTYSDDVRAIFTWDEYINLGDRDRTDDIGTIEINGGTFNAPETLKFQMEDVWKEQDQLNFVKAGTFKDEIGNEYLAAEMVCIQVTGEDDEMYQVGYLTVEDAKTGDTLYTNLGTGTTAMAPTLNLNNNKTVDDVTTTTKTQVTNEKHTKITWASADEKVATVDENGQIHAVGNGDVEITATYEVNGKTVTKTYTITVGTYYAPVYYEPVTPPEIEVDEPAVPLASGPVTRTQFVDYLWRHAGSPEADAPTFADTVDHELALAIGWAQSIGIVKGNSDKTFAPDDLVTTAAVRSILTRYAAYLGVEMPDLTTLTGDDGEAVLNCDQVLAEFFGEEYELPEDLDALETGDAA